MNEQAQFVPLPHLVDLKMGETIVASDCTGDGLPVFSADKNNEPWGYSSKLKVINNRGAIVIGARGTIGYPRLPNFDKFGATQTTIVATPINDAVDSEFLYYSLSQVDFGVPPL
ncbi:restriction endonuclease subunit S [Vreelandella utahensis]|uniref:restriction endonuclease subunit S n=1 Tax=Vreelandella halophila TaxID=86177 RepID=UPI0015C2E67A|nr:restriction endonuclease subunit S [Halomonas utahensis]